MTETRRSSAAAMREALEVAKIGFEQIETAPTITDIEIKRVCLLKINSVLNPHYRGGDNG